MGRLEPGDLSVDVREVTIGALFQRRYSAMVKLAAWLTNDSSAAEDLVQDAFVRVAKSDLSAVTSIDAYLRTTVVNLTRTRLKRLDLARRHRIVEIHALPGPESILADEELAAAVAQLPRRQRECVVHVTPKTWRWPISPVPCR